MGPQSITAYGQRIFTKEQLYQRLREIDQNPITVDRFIAATQALASFVNEASISMAVDSLLHRDRELNDVVFEMSGLIK